MSTFSWHLRLEPRIREARERASPSGPRHKSDASFEVCSGSRAGSCSISDSQSLHFRTFVLDEALLTLNPKP